VDHRPVGNGSVGELGRKLQDLYFEVVRGKVAKYAHWCTPVHKELRAPFRANHVVAVASK
jgi:branched-chain amino acid aminotransferase